MRRIPGRLADHGRPVPRETWDQQFRDGTWEWLDSIDDFAHYMVIAGYVHYLFTSPTILDVGCGQGRLAELLAPCSFERYLGIDLSAEAIKRARRRPGTHARFRVADLNEWHPPGRFSVIVFCESLNYALHPVSTLVRYARALERDGAIIVSLYRHRNHGRIWKNAARYFRIADSTTVINPKGATWDIRVLRPLPEVAETRTSTPGLKLTERHGHAKEFTRLDQPNLSVHTREVGKHSKQGEAPCPLTWC